jgi:hypothetical protein
VTPDTLRRAGELLLGADWKRPLARLLGPHHPQGARESMDPRLPFRWASGERPIPAWVGPVLGHLLAAQIETYETAAQDCRDLIEEIAEKG